MRVRARCETMMVSDECVKFRIELEEYQELLLDEVSLPSREDHKLLETEYGDYIKVKWSSRGMVLQASHYIGLLKLRNLTIVIRPKIGAGKFVEMFKWIDVSSLHVFEELVQKVAPDKLLVPNFLELFVEKTYQMLERHVHKDYRQRELLALTPRNKVKIAKSLQHANRLPRRFVVESFQRCLDTELNQVIHYTLLTIKPLIMGLTSGSTGFDVGITMKYLRLLMILKDVSVRHWFPEEIDHLQYDRMTAEYKHVHQMCKIILMKAFGTFKQGQHQSVAWMINAWEVFEKFVHAVISHFSRQLYEEGLLSFFPIVEYHSVIETKSESDLRPDIILRSKDDARTWAIIDVKYKEKLTRSDENQIYRYIGEEMKNWHSKAKLVGFLVHPHANEKVETEFYIKSILMDICDSSLVIHEIGIDLTLIDDFTYLKRFVMVLFEYVLQSTEKDDVETIMDS